MPENERLTAEQCELESALAGLTPHAPQCDSAALMFELGRRNERRRCRRWKAGAGALSLLLAVSVSMNMLGTAASESASRMVADREASDVAPPTPTAGNTLAAEHATPEASSTWTLSRNRRTASPGTPTDPRQTIGYLSRLVQEHGIEALPEPMLRFDSEPLSIAESL